KGRHFHAGPRIGITSLLEAKAEAELACKRARDVGAGWIDEARRSPESSIADIRGDVIAIVCTIRQVERLRHDLQIGLFADFDVLTQPGVELEERIAAQRIERHQMAASGKVAGLPG